MLTSAHVKLSVQSCLCGRDRRRCGSPATASGVAPAARARCGRSNRQRLPLPSEAASAGVTRFSFIAYGDTRSGGAVDVPGDGQIVQVEHSRVVDKMIARVRQGASTPFPVRFALQSGDAVLRGQNAAMWNVSFSPIIERLTRGGEYAVLLFGRQSRRDGMPAGDPGRALGLHNTLTRNVETDSAGRIAAAAERLSDLRFGYGNAFFIAFDSNIAGDQLQLAWVADQLEHLDRARYPHVFVFFHHPPFSAGPHGGASAEPMPGTGVKGRIASNRNRSRFATSTCRCSGSTM